MENEDLPPNAPHLLGKEHEMGKNTNSWFRWIGWRLVRLCYVVGLGYLLFRAWMTVQAQGAEHGPYVQAFVIGFVTVILAEVTKVYADSAHRQSELLEKERQSRASNALLANGLLDDIEENSDWEEIRNKKEQDNWFNRDRFDNARNAGLLAHLDPMHLWRIYDLYGQADRFNKSREKARVAGSPRHPQSDGSRYVDMDWRLEAQELASKFGKLHDDLHAAYHSCPEGNSGVT